MNGAGNADGRASPVQLSEVLRGCERPPNVCDAMDRDYGAAKSTVKYPPSVLRE